MKETMTIKFKELTSPEIKDEFFLKLKDLITNWISQNDDDLIIYLHQLLFEWVSKTETLIYCEIPSDYLDSLIEEQSVLETKILKTIESNPTLAAKIEEELAKIK